MTSPFWFRCGFGLVVTAACLCVFVPAHGQLLDSALPSSPTSCTGLLLDPAHPWGVGGGCGKACRAFHLAADRGWQPGELPPGARSGNHLRGSGPGDPTDVLHYALSIEIDPAVQFITGSNTMTVRSNMGGLSSFTFQLESHLNISVCEVTDSVGTYVVTPTLPPADSSAYERTITLSRPLNQGETFTLRVDYAGVPIVTGFGNFYSTRQMNFAAVPWVICTLSEPFYAGTWWPCKDGGRTAPGDNSDKASLTFSITAPELYTTTANGVLVNLDTSIPGKKTFTFATAYPIAPYLVGFSTTEYNSWTGTYTYPGGTMPLEFHLYPATDSPGARAKWNQVPAMMAALRPIFGEYAFVQEKYGIYQFEFDGGMEHQTNTGQGGRFMLLERLTVHELAHQWWGDNVTCKTWEDIWLNEGFATYAEALWEERKNGQTAATSPNARTALQTAMNQRRPTNLSQSVYCTDVTDPNRIFSEQPTYLKAAWVLHQLRFIVGETKFAAILDAYRAAYQGSAATTADFVAIVSSVVGENMDWYFNPWVYGIGAPKYVFAWEPAVINGQNYVRMMMKQTQQTVNPNYPVFTMPIEVRITTAAGSSTAVVRNDALVDYFLIPVPAVPTQASPDSLAWVLMIGGATSTTYVPGPPKIVTASPGPGSVTALADSPSALRIGFSDSVSISPSSFGISKAGVGGGEPVPFVLGYDQTTFVATLTFATALPAGTYNVAVLDTVATQVGGLQLDGEVLTNTAAALPSGDGVAGGPAAFTFTIAPPPCPADFNASGGVTIDDLFLYFNAYFQGSTAADFNGVGGVTIDDLFLYIHAYFVGC